MSDLTYRPHDRTMVPIRVMAVDDHPVVLDGINAVISAQTDMVMVGHARNAPSAIQSIRNVEPDVILMDLHLPGINGITATEAIRRTYPAIQVVILTTYCSEEDVRGAMQAGAHGYLLKEALRNEMIAAIRAVHGGRQYLPAEVAERLRDSREREALTHRELEVLFHASEGLSNSDIASTLRISHQTVKSHMKSILSKFGVTDRTQAILTGLRRGLVHLHGHRGE